MQMGRTEVGSIDRGIRHYLKTSGNKGFTQMKVSVEGHVERKGLSVLGIERSLEVTSLFSLLVLLFLN